MKVVLTSVLFLTLASSQLLAQPPGKERTVEHPTFYRTIQVDGLRPGHGGG